MLFPPREGVIFQSDGIGVQSMLLVLTDLLCKEKCLQRGMRPQDFCDSRQVQRIGLYGTDLVRKFGGIDRGMSTTTVS